MSPARFVRATPCILVTLEVRPDRHIGIRSEHSRRPGDVGVEGIQINNEGRGINVTLCVTDAGGGRRRLRMGTRVHAETILWSGGGVEGGL